jgi:hypothetical protein
VEVRRLAVPLVDVPLPLNRRHKLAGVAAAPPAAPSRCASPSSPARPVRHLGWVRRVELCVEDLFLCQTTPGSSGSIYAGEVAVVRRRLRAAAFAGVPAAIQFLSDGLDLIQLGVKPVSTGQPTCALSLSQ